MTYQYQWLKPDIVCFSSLSSDSEAPPEAPEDELETTLELEPTLEPELEVEVDDAPDDVAEGICSPTVSFEASDDELLFLFDGREITLPVSKSISSAFSSLSSIVTSSAPSVIFS